MKPRRLILEPWRLTMEPGHLTEKIWMVFRPVVADSLHSDEEPDPDPNQIKRSDPDPHQS